MSRFDSATPRPAAAGHRLAAPVLADAVALPEGRRLAADVALVLAGTAVVTLIAQIAIPLPGTPVPLTLGTFGVLAVGAALGPARGGAAVGLYVLLAFLGVPVLAGWGAAGIATASAGYVLGYLPAAVLLGAAGRRGDDRSIGRTVVAGVIGSALVYACGVPWLMAATGMGLAPALATGVLPFLVGDALKVIALALALPSCWTALRR